MRFEDSVCRGSLIPLIYRERETERGRGRDTGRQEDKQTERYIQKLKSQKQDVLELILYKKSYFQFSQIFQLFYITFYSVSVVLHNLSQIGSFFIFVHKILHFPL